MKKQLITSSLGIIISLSMSYFSSAAEIPDHALKVHSPNQQTTFYLFHDQQDQLAYGVTHKDKLIIPPSPMGITINGVELGKKVTVELLDTYKIDETSAIRGAHTVGHNHAVGSRFKVSQQGSDESCIVEARAYDHGVSYRYISQKRGKLTLTAEASGFTFLPGSKLWASLGNEEGVTVHGTVQKGKKTFSKNAYLPITAELPNQYFVAVLESDRHGMAAIRVCKDHGGGRFQAILSGSSVSNGTLSTPWRVIQINSNLNGLVNNDMVHHLATKADPGLFPQGVNTPWIKPGKIAWSWISGRGPKGVNIPNQKKYVDLAQKMNTPYLLVDEGWLHWNLEGAYDCGVKKCKKDHGETPWMAVKKLIDYSKERNVGVWLWKAYDNRRGVTGIKDPKHRRTFLKKCQALGVVGVKIDFFPAPSQEIIRWQEATLKEAAEFEIMVNFHGCAVPSGESRTYPNEMTREAIRGLEYGGRHYINQSARLPFNRLLAGHGDYTPLRPGSGGANLAHHTASVVILDSPIVHFCEHPSTIQSWGKQASELVMGIPECWDETIVLPQSTIGGTVAYARRKGDAWYLAVITASDVNMKIPLDFLKTKISYQMDEVTPGINPKNEIKVTTRKVDAKQTISLALKRGEGYLGRIQQPSR